MIDGSSSASVSPNTIAGARAAGSDTARGRFAGRDITVAYYLSFTRGWLAEFGERGRELTGQLDTLLESQVFPEFLHSSVAEVLAEAKTLTCHSVGTICHSGHVKTVSFSKDGRYLVTASWDHTAQLWEFIAGQWQVNATIQHSDRLNSSSFSPDGRHLVTASNDGTAKIWGLVAGQWREKATIRHSIRSDMLALAPMDAT